MLPAIQADPLTPFVRLRRLGFRVAYRLLQVYWFTFRPRTRGVKMLLLADDHVLFVRHSYGNRDKWELPGGGRKPGESAEQAATRETREETGVDVHEWTHLGTAEIRDKATADLTFLSGHAGEGPIRLDLAEIAEARWERGEHPPQPLGEHARAALRLVRKPAG